MYLHLYVILLHTITLNKIGLTSYFLTFMYKMTSPMIIGGCRVDESSHQRAIDVTDVHSASRHG